MKILVLGEVGNAFREVAANMLPNVFEYVSEVRSLTKEQSGILINGIEISKFNGVVLCDSSQIFNYVWYETSEIPWFSAPFIARTSSNHNYFFNLAETVGFKTATCTPHFEDGKVTVLRQNPQGEISRVFVVDSEVIWTEAEFSLEKNELRKIRTFMRLSQARAGVFTFVKGRFNELFFTEFTSIPKWDKIPKKVIRAFLERVISISRMNLNAANLRRR